VDKEQANALVQQYPVKAKATIHHAPNDHGLAVSENGHEAELITFSEARL